MTLVTGASGHLGREIINFILQKDPGHSLAALVRNEANAKELKAKGVITHIGDYSDKLSLEHAFKGIDRLVLVSSSTLHNRVDQHSTVIEAARTAGVKHILYTSALGTSPESKFIPGHDHFHTELRIFSSGLSYTILRHTFYYEVLPMLLGDSLSTGQWYYPSGQSKVNFASRTDMAEAIANIVLYPDPHHNKVYEITGQKSYSLQEVASLIRKNGWISFQYIDLPMDTWLAEARKAGVPDEALPVIKGVAEAINAGEFNTIDTSLEKLLGRAPVSLETFLSGFLQSFPSTRPSGVAEPAHQG